MTAAAESESSAPYYDVAILGAGFSGSLVAIHLAGSGPGPSVVLLEKSRAHGAGLAYGAAGHRHLLNVPAGRMSAFPDEPDHFLQWLRARPEEAADFGVTAIEAGSFLPRRLYGRYLTALVQEAAERSARLHLADAEALDLIPQADGSYVITLAGEETLRAGSIVLAAGNFPSKHPHGLDPALLADPRYLPSPWTPAATQILAAPGDVLVLGTGLTALDLLVTLHENKAAGHVHLLSRRGLFPNPHRTVPAHSLTFAWTPLPKTVRTLVRRVCAEIARAAAAGVDWRAVVDSLRPVTQDIWRGWENVERRRFLRHVRAYWEVARHRAAPQVFDAITALRDAGRLTVHRGRVQRLTPRAEGIEAVFRHGRASRPTHLHVRAIVNCTGPETNLRHVDSPLIAQLIARGLIQPDALGLGLEINLDGQAIDHHGHAAASLFATGALRKGLLWETTAVPELRAQAATLAKLLLARWKPASIGRTSTSASTLPPLEQVWAYEI